MEGRGGGGQEGAPPGQGSQGGLAGATAKGGHLAGVSGTWLYTDRGLCCNRPLSLSNTLYCLAPCFFLPLLLLVSVSAEPGTGAEKSISRWPGWKLAGLASTTFLSLLSTSLLLSHNEKERAKFETVKSTSKVQSRYYVRVYLLIFLHSRALVDFCRNTLYVQLNSSSTGITCHYSS